MRQAAGISPAMRPIIGEHARIAFYGPGERRALRSIRRSVSRGRSYYRLAQWSGSGISLQHVRGFLEITKIQKGRPGFPALPLGAFWELRPVQQDPADAWCPPFYFIFIFGRSFPSSGTTDTKVAARLAFARNSTWDLRPWQNKVWSGAHWPDIKAGMPGGCRAMTRDECLPGNHMFRRHRS